MLTFSILTTIAFGLFFLGFIGRTYLKGKTFFSIKLDGEDLRSVFVTAGLILLVIAVWV